MRRSARLTLQVGVAVFGVASILAATVIYLNLRGEDDVFSIPLRQTSNAQPVAMSAQIERGQYLALVGNCAGCHSNAGGAAYAGGRGVPTPFGTIYTSNLTPEKATGIGSWSPANFWRAMHNGRARDGRC